MSVLEPELIHEAALHALVSERCRRAYLHDMRGGLQGIYGALDLLARSAGSTGEDSLRMDKASALAKRAISSHEKSLERVLDQLLPRNEAAVPVNVGTLIEGLLQFLQNDAASKEITLAFSTTDDTVVLVPENKLRLVILGLLTSAIDASSTGAELRLALRRADNEASIEFCGVPAPAGTENGDVECGAAEDLQRRELLLSVAQRLVLAGGGRIEYRPDGTDGSAVRIYLPLVAP
jgi:signal transduction histidine kinase